MHIHWLQHAEHEDLGCIAAWLEEHGHSASSTRLYAGERPPHVDTFDALIVMGGPMNIYEHAAHPWLAAEKTAIRVAIDSGRRVLGICLGAQLIAEVLGPAGEPNVVRNAETELGFFPVSLTAEGRTHPCMAGLAKHFTAFHWHGDRYRLPPGALRLADSVACNEQAFVWGEHGQVLGLQFHLEVTQAGAREWFREMPQAQGRYVQPAERILADSVAFAANNAAMATVLGNFFGR